MILLANPLAQYNRYKSEVDDAIQRVLGKGHYILGDEVARFEEEFAHFLGVKAAIGVGSGTEAIHIALAACGIGPGDEVITVSHTAVATVAAIELTGAVPVFVDIDPVTFTLDPSKLESAYSPKVKAIVAVHLYGQAADLHPILAFAKKHHLRVIEDAAQAHGAMYDTRRVGSWGDMSCFSFYPTKNLGALGDGGAVVTNDPELAKRARLLREYGWEKRYVSQSRGWNSRLDELQAAVLRIKLTHLDRDNALRAAIAAIYDKKLKNISTPKIRAGSSHVYHLYVIRIPKRDELKKHLEKASIQALIHYPFPVHLQPAYRERLPVRGPMTQTESISSQILSLPLYPELDEESVASVVHAIGLFNP